MKLESIFSFSWAKKSDASRDQWTGIMLNYIICTFNILKTEQGGGGTLRGAKFGFLSKQLSKQTAFILLEKKKSKKFPPGKKREIKQGRTFKTIHICYGRSFGKVLPWIFSSQFLLFWYTSHAKLCTLRGRRGLGKQNKNGMLCHSFPTLEGCNLCWKLWLPLHSSLSLSLSLLPFWTKWLLASTSEARDGNNDLNSTKIVS